jgi:hypothetical protein
MNRFFITGLIKGFLVATPFLSMLVMMLALWGVVGKATYVEPGSIQTQTGFSLGAAKNMMVNDTKSQKISSTELDNPKVDADEQAPPEKVPSYEKIDWSKVI